MIGRRKWVRDSRIRPKRGGVRVVCYPRPVERLILWLHSSREKKRADAIPNGGHFCTGENESVARAHVSMCASSAKSKPRDEKERNVSKWMKLIYASISIRSSILRWRKNRPTQTDRERERRTKQSDVSARNGKRELLNGSIDMLRVQWPTDSNFTLTLIQTGFYHLLRAWHQQKEKKSTKKSYKEERNWMRRFHVLHKGERGREEKHTHTYSLTCIHALIGGERERGAVLRTSEMKSKRLSSCLDEENLFESNETEKERETLLLFLIPINPNREEGERTPFCVGSEEERQTDRQAGRRWMEVKHEKRNVHSSN